MPQQPVASASFKGYVTTYSAIAGKRPAELDAALGFAHGTLQAGFFVYALASPVANGEFVWRDRTHYSAGWHYDPTIREYVQRRDEFRAHLGKVHGYDEAATDRKIQQFMEQQRIALNTRSGPGRIVKVIPKHGPAGFPDSLLRNVPQWELTVYKSFLLITV